MTRHGNGVTRRRRRQTANGLNQLPEEGEETPMADPPNEYRRPHPQSMNTPYLEFDIARELQQLRLEPGWHSGHNAKTLVKYDGLRIVLIALKARSSIPEHHTEGHISIQTMVGHVQIRPTGEASSCGREGCSRWIRAYLTTWRRSRRAHSS